jgi:hypothetical protein
LEDKMTARKKTVSRKKTQKTAARRKAPRKQTPSRQRTALARLELELPPTFRAFERRVRTQLNHLERQVERAQVKYRRRAARLLREASHRLGHLEAQGERNWRKLSGRARRDSLSILRRLERAVEASGPRPAARRKKKAG